MRYPAKHTFSLNNFLKLTLFLLIPASTVADLRAQDQFMVAPTGRMFIDAGDFMSSKKELFPDGVALTDVWLGVRMSYHKWSSVINVAYNQNKVGLRAIYVNYELSDLLNFRFGSFIPQYGLRTTLSATSLSTMISPVANTAFNDGRQLGGMMVYHPAKYLLALSIHTEGDAAVNVLGSQGFAKEGFGISERSVYRPVCQDGRVIQMGLSGGWSTPRKNIGDEGNDSHDAFRFKSNFPSRIVQVSAVNALVDHAVDKWKFSPELLLNYRWLALESQYYYSIVNREKGYNDYRAFGMYVIVRALLRGNSYSYADYAGVLDSPLPKSLECVADYDYTDLSDHKAGIMGGKANNFSLSLNYYFNKYVILRLRYGYTHTWDRASDPHINLSSIMARLQIIF